MTTPTAIIDADIDCTDRNTYYAIEEGAIWKTANLFVAGAATWTKVFDAATEFESLIPGTYAEYRLLRIRCAPSVAGLVFVLCIANMEEGDSSGDCYLLRSSSFGASWSASLVGTLDSTIKPYTVTYSAVTHTYTTINPAHRFDPIHRRVGDAVLSVNPWAIAILFSGEPGMFGGSYIWTGITVAADTVNADYDLTTVGGNSLWGTPNNLLSIPDQAIADGWITDYLGAHDAGGNIDMPKEAGRLKVGMTDWHTTGSQPRTAVAQSWVFWGVPSYITPCALDVARTNPLWVYIGLHDRIVKSIDGGFTWVDLIITEGATDIAVDPQAAGVIYYWSTDGSVNYIVDTTWMGLLLTGSGVEYTPGRIIRSLNSGRLWVIDGGNLRMRNLGSWSVQATGLATGRSLRTYLGDKLVYVDANNIWYSANGGLSWTAKKGAWSDFAGGVAAHLTVAAP